MDDQTLIRAAGTLLWRPTPDGPEVALVHRALREDWSLPKGKLDPGEHVLAAAVRELLEETGQRVALGRPLPTRRYEVQGVPKEVQYWAAQGDGPPFQPTAEIDEVAWLPPAQARARLSYPADGEVIEAFLAGPAATVPLVVLRHTKAVKRQGWIHHDDEIRPLDSRGVAEARALVPLLAAFGITNVRSSDARRCMDTVAPYARSVGAPVWAEPLLSEPGFEAARHGALERVEELLADPTPLLLCTHRPVLPPVLKRLLKGSGFDAPAIPLEPGAFLVLHRDPAVLDGTAKGHPVVAVERHRS